MAKIFISHRRRDSTVAEKIAHALEGDRTGPAVTTFLDQNLKPGDDFRKAIDKNLRTSDGVLVVVALPDAVANTLIGYEIGVAEALSKPIIIVTPNRHSLSEFPEEF